MRKINKILIVFLLMVSVILWGGWRFLQSRTFGKFISGKVTTLVSQYTDLGINFENINLGVFPPSVTFNSVVTTLEDKNIQFQLRKLGFTFQISDIWETKLTIKEVALEQGYLKIKKINKAEGEKEESESKTPNPIKMTFDILNTLPVNFKTITMKDVFVNILNNNFNFKSLEVWRLKDNFYLDLSLQNFYIPQVIVKDEVLRLDQFDYKGQIFANKLIIQQAKLIDSVNIVKINGEVLDPFELEKLKYKLEVGGRAYLPHLHNYLEFSKIGKIENGLARFKASVDGDLKNFVFETKLKARKVVSNFVNGDIENFKMKMTKEQIIFQEADIRKGKGKLVLTKPFEFFNLKTKKFVEEPIIVDVDRFELSNALTFLKKSLHPLQGKITGNIIFTLGAKDFHFNVSKGSRISDFKLDFSDNGKGQPICQMSELNFESASFDIYGSDFYMKLNASSNESRINVEGEISDKGIRFKTHDTILSLKELAPLVGLKAEGVGPVKIDVDGTIDNAIMTVDMNLKKVNFEDFHYDHLEGKIIFDFNKNLMTFKDAKGNLNESHMAADGWLNYKDKTLEFDIHHPKLSLHDFKFMYKRIADPMTFIPPASSLDLKGNFKLSGKTDLEKLVVESKNLSFKNINVYQEVIDHGKTEFLFKEKKIYFKDFEFHKNKAIVKGHFDYDMKESLMHTTAELTKLNVQDLNVFSHMPFVFSSLLDTKFKYVKSPTLDQYTFDTKMYKSLIYGKKLKPSAFRLEKKNETLAVKGNLFGDILVVDSFTDFASNIKNSYLNANLDIHDIREALSIISRVDLTNIDMNGNASINVTSKFNYLDLENSDLVMKVGRFNLNRNLINVNYAKDQNNIVLRNGEIELWDFNIKGNYFSLVSKGEGNLNQRYHIKTKAHLDASILEIYENFIAKSGGTIYLSHEGSGQAKNHLSDISLYSSDFSLVTDILPVQILKSSLKARYKNGVFILEYLDGHLQSGRVYANGEINLKRIIPEINFSFNLDKAGFAILKRSTAIVSGKGEIIGNSIPYTLNGEFDIVSAQISDEITDFSSSTTILKTDYKYLPGDSRGEFDNVLAFNMEVSTLDPIVVSNSMADMKFSANVQVLGSEKKPKLDGKVSLIPGYNKLYFKNNEFLLNRGEIYFYEKEKITNPELDFNATSTINNYKLNIKLFGYLDTFSLEMTSDPVLSQKDILSLVAFGYTEDLSSNLSSSERESMTQVGVGSMLFDRFKINETLKNELGLQINLGTELAQDNTSVMNARGSNDSTSTTGRVRSATKIEVRKRLNEAMNLSVSSTMGGSIGQRQSMNLNYNLNKNFSVEGIYELKTNEEGEEDIIANSLGMDLKFRKSFK